MTVDSLLIVFNGVLASACSFALFKEFGDKWTRLLLSYLGSALWFILGISSFDILMGQNTTGESSIMFVVIGVGIGALVFLFATHDLLFGTVEEVDAGSAPERLLE